jgi:hypothetical protein
MCSATNAEHVSSMIGQYLNFPEMALLRGDPRLKAVRKKVGLPT